MEVKDFELSFKESIITIRKMRNHSVAEAELRKCTEESWLGAKIG